MRAEGHEYFAHAGMDQSKIIRLAGATAVWGAGMKPSEFIRIWGRGCHQKRFGGKDATNPFKFIGFGATIIGFGATGATKPYKFTGFGPPVDRILKYGSISWVFRGFCNTQ